MPGVLGDDLEGMAFKIGELEHPAVASCAPLIQESAACAFNRLAHVIDVRRLRHGNAAIGTGYGLTPSWRGFDISFKHSLLLKQYYIVVFWRAGERLSTSA